MTGIKNKERYLSVNEMLDLIREYSEREYQELMKAPVGITEDHIDYLLEKYPTEKAAREFLAKDLKDYQ